MNKIEKQIRNDVYDLPSNAFDKKYIDKLVGYAEMYANDFMPLYEGVNFIPFEKPKKAIKDIKKINDKAMYTSGDMTTIIGHFILDNGQTILLQDKQMFLDKLALEYENEGIELTQDETYMDMALEWYYYNTIGGYIEGIPAFAVLYSK